MPGRRRDRLVTAPDQREEAVRTDAELGVPAVVDEHFEVEQRPVERDGAADVGDAQVGERSGDHRSIIGPAVA